MRRLRFLLCRLGLFGLPVLGFAQLVTPPSVDWVSAPTSASVGQTVSIGVGGHANFSDNSDGNDWNSSGAVLARITIWLQRPGQSDWTVLSDWLSPWRTWADQWTSFTVNAAGTHYIKVQLMDGRPWFSGVYTYAISAVTPKPVITSSLTATVNQGQNVAYTITASGNPSRYGASGLPAGLNLNATSGAITGAIPTNGGVPGSNRTVASTITATNSLGSDTKTLTWAITASSITTNGSVSPAAITAGQAVTLTRAGTLNFGLAWTENVIWQPNGAAVVLGNKAMGSQSFTPTAGPGLYWYQIRFVDTYINFRDQWISFTVAPPAPAGLTVSNVQSYSAVLTWTAVSGAAGYDLYRNGVKLNTGGLLTGTSYTDATTQAGTTYTYTVKAVTADGIASASSAGVSATTIPATFELFTPRP
jgi:hypothetical protein